MKLEGLIDTDIFKAKKDALIEEKQQILENMKLDISSKAVESIKTIEVFLILENYQKIQNIWYCT